MDLKSGQRYSFSPKGFVKDSHGPYLAMRGPFGTVGLLDLTVKTNLGYPTNPRTKKPYKDEPDFNWKGLAGGK